MGGLLLPEPLNRLDLEAEVHQGCIGCPIEVSIPKELRLAPKVGRLAVAC